MRTRGIVDFTRGDVRRQLFAFSLPLFLSNLLQIAYNMADMAIVGRVLGKEGLSAVSIGGDVQHFLTFLAMGFSNAGQVIIAQYIGAGRKEDVGRFIAGMASFLLACAAATSVVCLLLRVPILRVMSTPAESFADTLAYSTVSIAGLVFIYGYNAGSAILRGMGDSFHPFLFVSLAALLNVGLDLVFVVGLRTGAEGAAFATVLSQGVSFLCCAAYLWRGRRALGLQVRGRDFLHWDPRLLAPLVKLGVPMAIKSASIQFSKLFVNSWVNSYGVTVSAFSGIAAKVDSISILFANAMNTAGAAMAGQNIAARRHGRVKEVMRVIAGVMLSIATVLSAATLLFPDRVFGLFTHDPDVLAVGRQYLPIAVLAFYGAALRSPMNALLNGSGNYRVNFATALLDGIIMRVGLALLFGLALHMGAFGFWLGGALAGFAPFVIGVFFYFFGSWRKGAATLEP